MISFVGAGPGAADLLTLRAVERLRAADVVVWASSLVPAAVLDHCRPGAAVHDSARMSLDEVLAVFAASPADAAVVRLHSGDPTLYSAIAEQVAWCRAAGRAFEVVPGVGSGSATAASAGRELTVPGVAQSVVHTRLAARTAASVPAGESVEALARTGATLCVYLSAARPEALRDALLCPGSALRPDTPVVVGHRVSWPDERLVEATVADLPAAIAGLGATTGVMVLVGDALAAVDPPVCSHVYSAGFTTSFRQGRDPAGGPPQP
ncbi:MAG TPA: cobalt-precorrin-4/precorrin-4 C(11)-methyltransferase [Acidimicrobiales bacterium]|nr:cobalt-precorrin-4/precorrin-4 C(11)-methyltransferase [Acidimicrobiales bacterium]